MNTSCLVGSRLYSAFQPHVASTMTCVAIMGCIPTMARQQEAPAPVQTLFVLERSDLSEMLVDPKDQRLKEAIGMLSSRIAELPGEAPDLDVRGATAINLMISTLSRPGRVAITVNAGNPADGLFGYGVVLSAFVKDEKEAQDMHSRVKEALAGVPLPPAPGGQKRFASMDDTQLPGAIGRLSFGPRKSAEGWRYEIIAGALDNPDGAWTQIPKASPDMKPVIRGRWDFAGLNNAVNLLGAFAGPQNPDVAKGIRQAGEYGLYGANALKVRFEYGYSEIESVGHVAIENAGKYAETFALSRDSLTAADLAAIPSDVTMASVSRGDLTLLKRAVEAGKQANPQFAPGLEQFKQLTGVDLVTDVIDTLGGTIGYYTSDATGGGSIGSLIAMVTVRDRAKFSAAQEKLVEFANRAATNAKDAGRYARITAWKESGISMTSLRFAGLPVPFEISYALTDHWLIAGLTPQAVVAAVKQTASESKGLIAKTRISELFRANRLSSVTFVDTSRMLRGGYPVASMLGSAVGNAVRTPPFVSKNSARDPGMVTPIFGELAKDTRDTIWTSRWDGDAFVVDLHSDRSLLVSIAGYSGATMQLALPIGVIAAVADARNKAQVENIDEMNGDDEKGEHPQSMLPMWEVDPVLVVSLASRDPVMGMAIGGSSFPWRVTR